ncbi:MULTISPECIES: hypothetical protein [unclassified Mycoplasma]|uniref:hypothetical protein n=1 Tax=unclassified Mycoplasma TaxID=2683645 RepID=UPI00211C26B3|nr:MULTISPECIES: hypothetical protein [unclassified Mycoplasma]UUM19676.1 hypothetical protein NPA11_02810 [Mycoplasma sp. 1578d]UUM24659.1 hypothetical protein NPA12_03105 [Mycoplasma sp. 3686d]
MKRKINKILYSTLLIGIFSSISLACSNNQSGSQKQEQPKTPVKNNEETKPSNPKSEQPAQPQVQPEKTKDNHIDLSKSMIQMSNVPSAIVKDFFDTGFLNKLTLVPNSSSNSIDIMVESSLFNQIKTYIQSDKNLKSNFINYLTSQIDKLNFLKDLKTIKLGELVQGTEKEQILVQDKAGKFVPLDLKKQNQYLPVKLDKNDNLVIEYQIKSNDSSNPINHTKSIKTGPESDKLTQEMTNLISEYIDKYQTLINAQLKTIKEYLEYLAKSLNAQPIFTATMGPFSKLLEVFQKDTINFTSTVTEFKNKAISKELTNALLSKLYFEFKNYLTKIIDATINDVFQIVTNNRAIGEQGIKDKIAQLKDNINKLKKSSVLKQVQSFLTTVEFFITKYDDSKIKDQAISESILYKPVNDSLSKWLGVNQEKVIALKIKPQDELLYLSKIIEAFVKVAKEIDDAQKELDKKPAQ